MTVTSGALADKPNRFSQWLTGVVLGVGLFSTVLGLIVLIGWHTRSATLIQVFPAFVPMQYNTALGFVLCGLALLLAVRDRRRLAATAGTMAGVIGILTLGEYVFSIDLGIDQLLREHYITVETSHPGRMAPNTATCFALIGLASASPLIAGRWLFRSLAPVILGSLVLGLGVVALSGYLAEMETAYGWGQLTRMAIHTAAGFIALGAGMICLIWRRDLSPEAILPRWFPVPICVSVHTVTVCFWLALEAEFAKMEGAASLPNGRSHILQALLVVGVLLGLALTLAAYLAQTARRRAVEVDSARLVLVGEIAERKRAEKTLRESEERFRGLFENAPLGYQSLDEKGNVIELNETWCKLLGYTKEEVLGRNFSEFIRPDFKEVFKENFAKFKNKGYILGVEFEMIKKDGSRIRVAINGRIGHHEDGSFKQTHCVLTDITERKRMEKEREDLIAKLETQNVELEQFTHTVSHDLKSPLITIKGFVGMLRQDLAAGDSGPVADDLARISNAVDKMDQLLRDLLELSRIGRFVNSSEDVPLEELAREARDLVDGQARERGVQVEISSNLPVVFGDRLRLLEVFQNLIDNAVKYIGDQSSPRVEIGSRRDGNQTICYVRDNGIGVEPRYHEKIFGLFDQLDPKVEGSGIGLALVKRIVEVHGGRVWIESQGLGQGSTFCFTIAAKSQSGESDPGGTLYY